MKVYFIDCIFDLLPFKMPDTSFNNYYLDVYKSDALCSQPLTSNNFYLHLNLTDNNKKSSCLTLALEHWFLSRFIADFMNSSITALLVILKPIEPFELQTQIQKQMNSKSSIKTLCLSSNHLKARTILFCFSIPADMQQYNRAIYPQILFNVQQSIVPISRRMERNHSSTPYRQLVKRFADCRIEL